jgi:LCP family protein required for cell wall assembly
MFVPGVGHLAARRRAQGWLLLLSFGVLVGAAALAATGVDHGRLISLALEPRALQIAMTLAITLGMTWLFVVLSSYAVTRPRFMTQSQRVVGGFVTVVLALVAVAPFAVSARYAYVQYDFVRHVFKDNRQVLAGGGSGVSGLDMFVGKPRVNVLLLGGDAGKGRVGVRTDSMTVASIDTQTGETVLISLPRNLVRVPFEAGTPMADRYPSGFDDLLNALYRYGDENPEVVPGAQYPGAELMKQTFTHVLGRQVDYFVLVNLDGFEQIVDALGGVEVDVRQRIPVGGRATSDGVVIEQPRRYIEPGLQELDGEDALWFGRARIGSDDYIRMARQRCLLGAIARQADPLTVLTRFQQIASTAKELVLTDIPQQALPPLTQLAFKGKQAKITSLQFVRSEEFQPSDPDYDYILEKVSDALTKKDLEATPTETPSTGSPSGGGGTPTGDGGSSGSGPAPGGSAGPGGAGARSTPMPPAGKPVSLDEVC